MSGHGSAVRGAWEHLLTRTRRLVDSAMDRVFARPFDVRDHDDFRRLLVDHTPATASPAFARFAETALSVLVLSGKAGRKLPIPAARYALLALPVTLRLADSARRGVRELQVIASYVVHRFRDEGIEADQDLVVALTLSLALDPSRRVDVTMTPRRASAGLLRVWAAHAMVRNVERELTRRAEADVTAISRLDLRELVEEWRERQSFDGGQVRKGV